MRRFLAIALALLPASSPAQLASAQPAAERKVIDRVVAVVNKEPLLLSELMLEARVVLINQGGVLAAQAELADAELASALEYSIGQRLAWAEADRLQVFAVDEEEVARALNELAGHFPSRAKYQAFLQQQEASEDQLAAILRRQLRVARYLDSRVKLAARVSEEELRRFYQEHQDDFVGQGFSQVREGIKAALTRDRYRQLAKRLMDELRARAEVRVVAHFGEPGGAGKRQP